MSDPYHWIASRGGAEFRASSCSGTRILPHPTPKSSARKSASRPLRALKIADDVRRDRPADLLEGVDILGPVNPFSQESGRKHMIEFIILLPPDLRVNRRRDAKAVLEPPLLDEVAPAAQPRLGLDLRRDVGVQLEIERLIEFRRGNREPVVARRRRARARPCACLPTSIARASQILRGLFSALARRPKPDP